MADLFSRATVSTTRTVLRRLAAAAALSAVLPLVAQAQTITPAPIPGKPAAPAASQPAAPKPAAPAKPAAEKPAKPAAEKPATAPVVEAPAPEDDPSPWIKVCSKDDEKRNVCFVAKELRSQEGRLVAQVALREVEGDPKKVLMISLPPPVLVQPGMRVGVDKGKLETANFTICFPNTCAAEMPVSDQFLADMKKGKVLVALSLDLSQKAQAYPFGLSNFKAALEGPAIDPQATQQSQEQLQQQLNKKAEEAAKKLGGDAAPAPAADPAATPAPAAPKP